MLAHTWAESWVGYVSRDIQSDYGLPMYIELFRQLFFLCHINGCQFDLWPLKFGSGGFKCSCHTLTFCRQLRIWQTRRGKTNVWSLFSEVFLSCMSNLSKPIGLTQMGSCPEFQLNPQLQVIHHLVQSIAWSSLKFFTLEMHLLICSHKHTHI